MPRFVQPDAVIASYERFMRDQSCACAMPAPRTMGRTKLRHQVAQRLSVSIVPLQDALLPVYPHLRSFALGTQSVGNDR